MSTPIKTVFEFPPIPDRRFDWCAYHEGDEESGCRGWGRTEAEAVADLQQLDEERAEEDCEGHYGLGEHCERCGARI